MKTFMSIGLMLAVVACGSSSADKSPSPTSNHSDSTQPSYDDAGNEVASDAGVSVEAATAVTDAGPKTPTNQAECVAVCESKYPKQAGQNKQLDNSCFLAGSCEPACNGLVVGKNYQPSVDPDAGPTCDTVKANSYPISTPSQACSDCLASTPTCCSLWIAIFSSDDGKALNSCSNNCFSQFKN